MNKLIAIITILLISVATSAQTPFKGADYQFYYQVNIGKTNGTSTTPSAWLEVGKDSTNKGLRVPRVVDTANVTSPIYGLIIYQIKDNFLYFRDKVSWKRIADQTALNQYLLKSDSTTYYPYWSNPRNYISTESDPVANAKTVRWIAGDGILISNTAAQPLSSNPVATITANSDAAMWNANELQGSPIAGIVPTIGQFLSYNGSQYVPTSPPAAGTVNSVALSLPSAVYDISGSPVTNTGTLTGTFKNQLANLMFASPNGTSGVPSFRSLAYPDFPISGVVPGTYGNDTTLAKFTVNDRGVLTSSGSSLLGPLFIRNQDAYIQSGKFKINGFGEMGGLITTSPAIIRSVSGGLSGTTVLRFTEPTLGNRYGLLGKSSPLNWDIQLASDSGAIVIAPKLISAIIADTDRVVLPRRELRLGNQTYNHLIFEPTVMSFGPPSLTNRSWGTKVVYNPNLTAFLADYATGIETNYLWNSVPSVSPSFGFKWYGGVTQIASLTSDALTISGNIVAAAPAYVSGGFSPLVRNNATGRFELGSVGGSGTVTSVALAAPGEFSVSGSPVTTSGTLTISKLNQSANTVYAGPASGGAATPAFRAIVRADIPKYNITNISDSDYSVVSTDDFVILSSTITANRTITLPSAGSNTGRIIHLINLEMNGTFGYSPSPALLNNSNTLATGLGNNTATTIYSDGTNWRILHSTTN